MKPIFKTLAVAAFTFATSLSAHAAPKQIVVVVAEGLNPQMIELGSSYLKYAAPDETAPTALADFKSKAKAQMAPVDALNSLKSLLKNAGAAGWKTGLVTDGDLTQVAPLFYDLPTPGAPAALALVNDVRADFLGGGGRAAFGADLKNALVKAGGTALFDADTFEANEGELKGKTLSLQAEGPLSYAIDRDAATEAGLGDMASLALQKLSEGDRPFLLVIHDALLGKAVVAHDTPAVFEQLRELDGIVSDLSAARDAKDKPADMGVALLATGSAEAPQWTTDDATARSNAFFVLSELPVSFSHAGQTLQGATADKLTAFATDEYKGWKLSEADRAAILAGTLSPEAALRASYEPTFALKYAPTAPDATLYALGLDLNGDPIAALNAIALLPMK